MRRVAVGWMVAGLAWLAWIGGTRALPRLVASTSVQPEPGTDRPRPAIAAGEDPCGLALRGSRRVFVNITYQSPDPPAAADTARRAMQHREGQVDYLYAAAPRRRSSLNGWLPAGTGLDWLSDLDGARVVNIGNTDSPLEPELDRLCSRLAAAEAGEDLLVDALRDGADREAVRLGLELHRNEIQHLRSQLGSLQVEAGRVQVNLSFDPPG